jgi:hypothetical protein
MYLPAGRLRRGLPNGGHEPLPKAEAELRLPAYPQSRRPGVKPGAWSPRTAAG